MDFIKDWGVIAGIGGIALGVFLLLFRRFIESDLLSKLTKKQSYVVMISFLVLVSIVSSVSLVGYFRNNQSIDSQLTVFVTDALGNVVLENEGLIMIPMGNRALREKIGYNGRTNFPDITQSNLGDTINIGLEVKGWDLLSKKKHIFQGSPIHLVVGKSKESRTIRGVVLSRDGDSLLEDCKIMINSDTVIFSQKDGVFNTLLPTKMGISKITDKYTLRVSKDGYLPETVHYSPYSSFSEVRLSPK